MNLNLLTALLVLSATPGVVSAGGGPSGDPAAFSGTLDTVLAAMKKKAEAMNIKGVAVVAYAEGDTVKAWTSKMLVVGNMTVPASEPNKWNNLLGIAYTKASEMADTLKDSGSHVRPPMTGEYGWQGGKVAKGKTGILIAAFSGAESSQDAQVSQVAIDELLKAGL